MATIIYKKFIKPKLNKNESLSKPNPKPQCVHQQTSNRLTTLAEDGLSTPATAYQSDHQAPEKLPEHSTTVDTGVSGSCAICKEEDRAANIYRWKLVAGLFAPFSVQALDTTIIAGALPFIASDFHELSQLNWIVSASALTSAAFIPFWGQFADVFGRYAAIQGALIVTVIGSAICSGAPTTAFPMLLVGRALQGIGCAGLLINTKIILADKVSLKENAKNNTVFTVVGGISYGLGPVIGGYLTEASWRWCFIINIPLGIIGIAASHFILRPELLGPKKIITIDGGIEREVHPTFKAKLATIDFGGQFLFLFGIGLLVLGLTWGGSYYPWSDVKVIAPLVTSVVLIICFLIWEYLLLPGGPLALHYPTQNAMIPLKLLWSRNAGLLMYINFVTGMALEAVFYFVSVYFALVQGYDPGESGKNLTFYLPGMAGGAFMAMYACNVWPLQTFFPILLGTIIEPLGITLLAIAISNGNLNVIYGMLALTGVGTGIRLMPGTLHGVGYFPTSISSIVSLMSLSISLGGTISTTLMLNIFNNHVHSSGLTFNSASSSSFTAISALPPKQQEFLKTTAQDGISLAFFALTAFCWLGVVAAAALGNVRIGKKGKDGVWEKDRTIKGSYIGSLLWRRGENLEGGKEVCA